MPQHFKLEVLHTWYGMSQDTTGITLYFLLSVSYVKPLKLPEFWSHDTLNKNLLKIIETMRLHVLAFHQKSLPRASQGTIFYKI